MREVRKISVLATAGLVGVLGIGVTGAGASAAHHAQPALASAHATKMKKLAFSATYTGVVKILWGSSAVNGTVTGSGKGTLLGAGAITAVGATKTFSTQTQSDPLKGSAVLKGPGGSFTVSTVSVTASTTSTANPTSSVPDPITVAGTVKVSKGTGKFAGATGTLSVHATFTVNTTTGTEKQNFQATLKGNLSVKA